MQTRYIFENWAKVLAAAGSGLEQGLKSQGMEVDFTNFHDMDGIWGQYMGHGAGVPPPGRSSMAMRGLLVPDALLVVNCFFLAPDADHQKVESREGIRWHPVDVRKVNFTPGLFAGDWFFMAGQGAIPDYENLRVTTAPPGLPHYFSDIEIHTEATMELLQEQMEGNGMTLRDIVDARVYLVEPRRDYRGFRAGLAADLRAAGTLAEHQSHPLQGGRRRQRGDAAGQAPARRDRPHRAPGARGLAAAGRARSQAATAIRAQGGDMMAAIAQALNVLPAPRFARQGDFIYVSTIYPLTPAGEVVRSDGVSPYVGEAGDRRADASDPGDDGRGPGGGRQLAGAGAQGRGLPSGPDGVLRVQAGMARILPSRAPSAAASGWPTARWSGGGPSAPTTSGPTTSSTSGRRTAGPGAGGPSGTRARGSAAAATSPGACAPTTSSPG